MAGNEASSLRALTAERKREAKAQPRQQGRKEKKIPREGGGNTGNHTLCGEEKSCRSAKLARGEGRLKPSRASTPGRERTQTVRQHLLREGGGRKKEEKSPLPSTFPKRRLVSATSPRQEKKTHILENFSFLVKKGGLR